MSSNGDRCVKDPDKYGRRSLAELKADLRAVDAAIRILQEERGKIADRMNGAAYAVYLNEKKAAEA